MFAAPLDEGRCAADAVGNVAPEPDGHAFELLERHVGCVEPAQCAQCGRRVGASAAEPACMGMTFSSVSAAPPSTPVSSKNSAAAR